MASDTYVRLSLQDAKRIWERARGQFADDDMEDYFAVSNLHKAIREAERDLLRQDVEELWPKMEAGMRYLGRKSGEE